MHPRMAAGQGGAVPQAGPRLALTGSDCLASADGYPIMNHIYALTVCIALTGCASAPAVVEPTHAVGIAALRTQGELAIAADQLGFAPCKGSAGAAIDATAGGEATALLRELNGGDEGSAFVDVHAAQSTDGTWRIDRLLRAYRDGPRCRDNPRKYVWRAAGTDSPWSMEATPRYVVVRRAAGADPDFYRFRAFTATAGGAWTYSAQNAAAAVNIVLRNTRCRAADGRAVTAWSIELSTRGELLRGCAWNGAPQE